jgi:heptosyltransferase-2
VNPTEPDNRPRTAVLHQFVGMGDLVWHIPYLREIAARSQGGRIAVIASPTTFARDLLGHEPWVAEVIDFDRRPRRTEKRQGRHAGVAGLFRMGRELRGLRFERIVLFSHHANRALVAWHARIPERLGFGSGWLQRSLLSRGPYIAGYRGPSVPVYKDATAFSLAHGWCRAAIVPRLCVRPDAQAQMAEVLAELPRPRYAFAIGTSEPFKQWGAARFAALADALITRGCGVLLLGGPAETALAAEIAAGVPASQRSALMAITQRSVSDSVAALDLCDAGIGNDTGISNMAAAVGKPSYVLLGPRPLLDHDPLMRLLRAPRLDDISVDSVLQRLTVDAAPGFGTRR